MDFVTPGKIIGQFQDGYVVGEGAYVSGNDIISSLFGKLEVKKTTEDDVETVFIDVINPKSKDLVPAVGKLVVCQVTRITHKFCQCRILMVDATILRSPFTGFIRKEDVRVTEKDKVDMSECFKIGDKVIARVASLDTTLGFLLTTTENELGVIGALSESGNQLQAVSHKEMRCPKTGASESRTVACPQKRHLKS